MQANTLVRKKLIGRVMTILVIATLFGCKQGEETGSSSPSSQQNTSSSLLSDNKLPVEAVVDNFEMKTINIDPTMLPFGGNRLFLKLSLQSGEVLFLGEIDRFSPFTLQVDLLLDVSSVNYELFSDSPEDEMQTGVITL